MNEADRLLVKRLLAGESKAYARCIHLYQGAMRAVAYAIVGARGCDDVVQDAWLLVVRNLAGFEGRSSLKTWLLTLTANLAKSRYRKLRREVLFCDVVSAHGTVDAEHFSSEGEHWRVAPFAWHQDTPEALLTQDELRQCLEHTLECLPTMQRGVLLLRERQGMALEDIGGVLDLSLSNVRVLLHRARLKIYAAVEHFENNGEC